ncbi:MAG TPA: 5'-3' exonuclease H3TH domain-containing protein, partial [Dehalococcoidia bacterium]|nr:5'-3' exonuclease H3TH domain-containing protein [Dehalococcoidia bacterium]
TYELFRHHFAVPSRITSEGREVAATVGVLGSVLGMLESGVTHLGVATDHVIESFRNEMWPGYKTSAGVDPRLLQQFPLLEEALDAMGVVVWPMVELEADDALASAAALATSTEVDRVYICTPDKDLGQCVRGDRVVQLNRRTRSVFDEAGIVAKFGVAPGSIPDYLALVGDSADGYPGLPGWGARSAAAVLARWRRFEEFPADCASWNVDARNAERLCRTFASQRELAYLFRDLATLRSGERLFESVQSLLWTGPRSVFEALARRLDAPDLAVRARRVGAGR